MFHRMFLMLVATSLMCGAARAYDPPLDSAEAAKESRESPQSEGAPRESGRRDGGSRERQSGGPPNSSWNEHGRGPEGRSSEGRGPEGRGPGSAPHGSGPHGPGAHGRGWHSFGSELRERDPEMAKLFEQDFELERKTMQLVDDFRNAPSDNAREEARKRLKETVAKHFTIRQERRELELKRLEEQLDRLRASVKQRAEQQGAIIDSRLRELIDDEDMPRF